jgi:hypothetical protein
MGAVPSRSSIYRCRKRHGLIDLRRRRKRREDVGRWERDRLMQLWQIEVMGGVMLEAGAELKVVTGLDPETGATGHFPPVPRLGGEDNVVARRPSRRRASEPWSSSRGSGALGVSQRSSRR